MNYGMASTNNMGIRGAPLEAKHREEIIGGGAGI